MDVCRAGACASKGRDGPSVDRLPGSPVASTGDLAPAGRRQVAQKPWSGPQWNWDQQHGVLRTNRVAYVVSGAVDKPLSGACTCHTPTFLGRTERIGCSQSEFSATRATMTDSRHVAKRVARNSGQRAIATR